ncbi:MAG: FtsX-like permease family protein [bacterium]|nr:FtsX-like permease family protein [bacterium]
MKIFNNTKNKKLPGFGLWIIMKIIPDYDYRFFLGDIEESYLTMLESRGEIYTYFWFWYQLLKTIPPIIFDNVYRGSVMLKNYVKIAMRSLFKSKVHSTINVFGLSTGIAICIIIFFTVKSDLEYDRFHEDVENIYLVCSESSRGIGVTTPGPLSEALLGNFPEVDLALRLTRQTTVVRIGENIFQERLLIADQDFFNFFSFMLESDDNSVLNDINNVIISKDAALKYFSTDNPVGEKILIKAGSQFRSFNIAGVINKIPENSSIKFDFLLHLNSMKEFFSEDELNGNWSISAFSTFVKLKQGTDRIELESKMPEFISKYYNQRMLDRYKLKYVLNPFADYHLASYGRGNGLEAHSNPVFLYILSGIALLILVIACINYMNFSVGRSSARFVEIGLRKVIGARRRQLISQFIVESVMLGIISLMTGMILAKIFLPTFNSISGKAIILNYLENPLSVMILLCAVLLSSLLTGIYPAIMLSRMSTSRIFKGEQKLGGSNLFSKTLLIFQYAVSTVLIICTLFMNLQQEFIRNKDLGFNRENVIMIPTTVDGTDRQRGDRELDYFKNQFLDDNDIIAITGSSSSFDRSNRIRGFRNRHGESVRVYMLKVDYDYLDTFGIELLQGRYFDKELISDNSESVVVNESYLRHFDIQEPIGEIARGFRMERGKDAKIIGVIKDYHVNNLKNEIPPMILNRYQDTMLGFIYVKFVPGKLQIVLDKLKKAWTEKNPYDPFEYYILDEDVLRLYESERQWSRIISISSILGIVISCLGLAGLTSITVSRRIKEIGIRKILGADISEIVRLLNREFILLISLANIIGWPLAFFVINRWLQSFEYRMDLGISVFIITGLFTLVIAVLTISIQSIKAAVANPVDTIMCD